MNNNKDINEAKFKKEILPIFNKIEFSGTLPFLIPPLKDQEEYNYMFYIFFHGAIYKSLLLIKEVQELFYSEYIDTYQRCISTEKFDGVVTVYYFKEPILIIKNHTDSETNLTTEAIYPIFQLGKSYDDNDITKQKKNPDNFNDVTSTFINSDPLNDFDFDFDDFDDFDDLIDSGMQ